MAGKGVPTDHSSQYGLRVAQLLEMQSKGINPFPEEAHLSHTNAEALAEPEGTSVTVGGRIISRREHGEITFLDIRDDSDTGPLPPVKRGEKKGQPDWSRRGALQIVVKTDVIQTPEIMQYLGIGDFVRVKGARMATKSGQQSVMAETIEMTSKALKQLPQALEDENVAYRMRAVDIAVNPEKAETFRQRAKITGSVRRTLEENGFIEIETPIMQSVYGGANARPFITHVHAWDIDQYLQISPELYLKVALMGGIERVYAMARNFRNEGVDKTHNPEFTMMECYHANWDADDMMRMTEEIYRNACMSVHGKPEFEFDGKSFDMSKPWRKLTMRDGIRQYLHLDVDQMSDDEVKQAIVDNGENYKGEWVRGLGIAKLFGAVEKYLIDPTFVIEYPIETTSLCKEDPENPGWIKRSEPYINGMEIGNLYSELNNPLVQQAAWEAEHDMEDGHPMDLAFLEQMRYGMPPAGGLGLGIDRMVMLILNKQKLRDVIFAPTMRPLTNMNEINAEGDAQAE